jgi:hypothetical protein
MTDTAAPFPEGAAGLSVICAFLPQSLKKLQDDCAIPAI